MPSPPHTRAHARPLDTSSPLDRPLHTSSPHGDRPLDTSSPRERPLDTSSRRTDDHPLTALGCPTTPTLTLALTPSPSPSPRPSPSPAPDQVGLMFSVVCIGYMLGALPIGARTPILTLA